jgi:hypothetical protein
MLIGIKFKTQNGIDWVADALTHVSTIQPSKGVFWKVYQTAWHNVLIVLSYLSDVFRR